MTATFKRALVTGGAGFIGHHLVRALLARGLEVTVLDDLSVGKRENVPEAAKFVQGDVRDPEAVTMALAGVDCVFHEAAIVSIRASVEGFVHDGDVNLLGTLNLLQCMADSGVRRGVFASSMAVYADSPGPQPLREDAPLRPISPYGIAKLAAEQYWLMMSAHFGIEATALRYFNTYGPGQTPTPYVGVITIFITKLLRGEAPVIFGDGEQRRDFVHVEDIVGANLAVLDAPAAAAAGRVFNVGTGHATSVNDVAKGLVAILKPGSAPRHAPAVEGEMRNAIADVSAIGAALGWKPKRTRVDFESVVEYWRASVGRT
ncbi:MAG: NAD-dependent epimerase/dehydratase family protein [Planctomycetota bacterium]